MVLTAEEKKERQKERSRLYKENNKEKEKERCKNYRQTEKGIKSRIITGWKRICVKNDDYDSLYDYYLNCKFCEECNIDFTLCKKCLDHDHDSGKFRNVLCNRCNTKRGYRDRGHIPLTQAEIAWKCRLKAFIFS